MTSQRVRNLGAEEHLLLRVLEADGGSRLVRVVEFEGPVDAALMETAFRHMVARRPILRCRITRGEPGEVPFFVMDDSLAPAFSVVERRGPDDWVREFHRELNTPGLGTYGQPPVRACLLASDEPGGELLVSCMHSFSDGRSLFRFCRDLLSEYDALQRGEGGDPNLATSGISPAIGDLLPEWATTERRREIVADYLARQEKLAPPTPWPSQRGASDEPSTTRVSKLDFTAEQLSAAYGNARANGTTVHGLLGAAMVLASDDVLHLAPHDEIVTATALDLRGALREPVPVENMGTYAATHLNRSSDVRKIPEWDVARDFKAQITAGIERYDHYVWVFMGEQFVESFTGGDVPSYTTVLTNLGALELPTEGMALRPHTIRGGTNVHMSRWPFIFAQAVGVNGRLALTLTHAHPEISDERAEEFAAALSERIRWFTTHAD